jgi:hypothetical protein
MDFRHLAGASRSAARFAAGSVEGRHPTNGEVAAHAASVGRPLAVDPASVTVANSAGVPTNNAVGRPGSAVTVSLTATLSPGFYGALSSVFNTLGSVVGVKPLRPVELHSSASATYR